MSDTIETVDATAITDIALVTVYVNDFATAFTFYKETLGLEKGFEMGPNAYYFNLGERGLYLEGGNTPVEVGVKTARSSFALQVGSASAMFEKLTAAGARCVQEKPVDMGGDNFWFQFYDPAGNILEIVGSK